MKIISIAIISIWILFTGNLSYSQSVSTSLIEKESSSTNSNLQIKPSLTVGGGKTSNVGKLQIETPGTFGKVSPSLSFEYTPSDAVVVNTQLSADLKQYSDEKSKALADEKSGELRAAIIWFATDSWEFGGDLGASYTENKLPVQISSSETAAQSQKYLEPDSRIYAAWASDKIILETGLTAKNRQYSTTIDDRGNTFYNNYNQIAADLKFSYSFSKNFKLSIRNLIEDKKYQEKPADFSDGAASVSTSPNPILEETATEHSLIAEYNFGKTKFVTTPGIRINKDRVFGARDSQALKLQQKMNLPITSKLSWAPAISISKEKFSKFHSDPENDPFNSPLREDSDFKITSPLKYALQNNIQINLEYGFLKKDSNYANSSYTDTTISTGLTISM